MQKVKSSARSGLCLLAVLGFVLCSPALVLSEGREIRPSAATGQEGEQDKPSNDANELANKLANPNVALGFLAVPIRTVGMVELNLCQEISSNGPFVSVATSRPA